MMSAVGDVVLATEREQPVAARVERILRAGGSDRRPILLVGREGEAVELPDALKEAVGRAATALAEGYGVAVVPLPPMLPIQAAAELLGVSTSSVRRLLESGALPCEVVRGHRLIRLGDLLDFRRRRDLEREAILGRIVREAQEDGTYDDPLASSG